MRPARIIAAVALAAAVAATGAYVAVSTATHPSAAAQQPAPSSPVRSAPAAQPRPDAGPGLPTGSTTSPAGDPPAPGRCAASALRGSVLDQEGAAGTIYTTVGLRNLSATTCTVKGIPQVRLLDDQNQPVTAPSVPGGPAGSPVVLRPGGAARFVFGRPNVCDDSVVGSRVVVTLPQERGSLVVDLGGDTPFGTCANVGVRALEAATSSTGGGRISDPQVAADRLVAAWVGGDRAAAGSLAGLAVTDRLFRQSPPARTPAAAPCRLVPNPATYVCSYPLQRAELSVFVQGGASAGYRITGIEFGD
jgi:hypothetical protein